MPDSAPGLDLHRRWVQANAWAQGLGLGATLVLAGLLGQHLGDSPATSTALLEALGAILAGTLLEGVLLGFLQGMVLRDHLPGLRPAAWVAVTSVGAAVAWALGMVPSTLMSLNSPAQGGAPPSPPEGAIVYLLAAGLGAVLGPFLGVPQALLFRRWVAHPWRWVPANMLAWAAGMPLVFLGMGTLPEHPTLLRGILTAFTTAFGAGLVVGLVHGRFLVTLLSTPKMTSN